MTIFSFKSDFLELYNVGIAELKLEAVLAIKAF